MSALDEWREQLAGWGIPEEILRRAPEPPWGFHPEPFARRAAAARASPETPSRVRAREALPEGGTVLDVGAGAGAASLPLVPPASRIVAVDESERLLSELRALAEAEGVAHEIVTGRWPDVAGTVPDADVVVCHHVLYNVGDLRPFVEALDGHAGRRVVVEITAEHPLAWMRDLWQTFHGLSRPRGPTADDALAALGAVGLRVQREDFPAARFQGGYAQREDALGFVRRRLCLPAERDREIGEALGDRLVEHEGVWFAGPPGRLLVTLWWDA